MTVTPIGGAGGHETGGAAAAARAALPTGSATLGGLRSPLAFLMSLSFVNMLGFAAWTALLNNFAKERADFTGFEIGLLQSVREIPGLLAVTALLWLAFMREQTLAYASLVLLAVGVALTGYFPTLGGLLATTLIMSFGFHYMETANQSLQLQLLPKADAPRLLGRIGGAGAAAQFLAYGGIALAWVTLSPSYESLFLFAGLSCLVLTAAMARFFPRFVGPVPQRKGLVLRRRYWLYYALTMMSGARRQIFTAFAGFLLVERFGFTLAQIASLFLVTCAVNTLAAPVLGSLVGKLGERATILMENVVLVAVFLGYATLSDGRLVAALYVIDGVFFTLTLAQKTYFQKIADPADVAPTAAVAFTINHIMAVAIPVVFGLLWLKSPDIVFTLGAGIAATSLLLALLVPRDPSDGMETVLSGREPRAAALPAR